MSFILNCNAYSMSTTTTDHDRPQIDKTELLACFDFPLLLSLFTALGIFLQECVRTSMCALMACFASGML